MMTFHDLIGLLQNLHRLGRFTQGCTVSEPFLDLRTCET